MNTETVAGGFVLPFLAEYHDSVPGDERKTMIREIFVPRRITPSGVRRVPVRLDIRRRVELRWAGVSMGGLTRSLGLDRVHLDLSRGALGATDIRRPLEIAIEARIPGLWWRFLGRVIRAGALGRRMTVELGQTIGCEVRRPSSARGEQQANAGGEHGANAR